MVRFVIVVASALLFVAAACSEQPSPASPSPVPSVSVTTPSFVAPLPTGEAAVITTRGHGENHTYGHSYIKNGQAFFDTESAPETGNPCSLFHNHHHSIVMSVGEWNCGNGQGLEEDGSTVNILD